MPFPNFQNKYSGKPVLTAQDVIAYQSKLGYLRKKPPQLDAAIICLKRGLPERLRRRHPYKKAGHYIGDLYQLKKPAKTVAAMANFGFGAPVVASLAEELIALGAKRIVSLSLAGAISSALASGDIVLSDRAIRDEGVSHHYLPAEKYISADSGLTQAIRDQLQARGKSTKVGTTWSTDAPFRETKEEIAQYQGEGALVVEMETSALFAVGHYYGIETASVLVVGDSLADGSWRAPEDVSLLDRTFEIAYDAVIDILDH